MRVAQSLAWLLLLNARRKVAAPRQPSNVNGTSEAAQSPDKTRRPASAGRHCSVLRSHAVFLSGRLSDRWNRQPQFEFRSVPLVVPDLQGNPALFEIGYCAKARQKKMDDFGRRRAAEGSRCAYWLWRS